MADTREVVLEWQKSPQYRFIPAQNVTVTTADTGDGPSALLHFTNTLVDIKEESFSAERKVFQQREMPKGVSSRQAKCNSSWAQQSTGKQP
jgi:hypothetical protein